MTRLPILFATAAAAVLLLGLLASRLHLQPGFALSLPRGGYFVPFEMLCFGGAFFLCLFAFVYSIWMMPWSARAAMWHFGLSIFCVGLFVISSILMERFTTPNRPTSSDLPVVIAVWISPVLFLLVQVFYILDGLRRCLTTILRT